MDIQTKVITTTQITLSQAEINEAIVDFVKAKAEVPADGKFEVEFEDDIKTDDLVAIVTVVGGTAQPKTPVPVSPKTTRRTTTLIKPPETPKSTVEQRNTFVIPEGHEAVIGDDGKPNGETRPIQKASETPAPANDTATTAETPAEEPPFEPDPPKTEVKAETPAKPSATVTKIFPDPATSAPTPPPPQTVQEEATVKAKSLFANLGRPVNG